MKTPTLIVRLVGIYLSIQSLIALVQISRFTALASGAPGASNDAVDQIRLLSILGLVVGLVATAFAGLLARWLTFDSEPGQRAADLSERLIAAPSTKPDRKPEPAR